MQDVSWFSDLPDIKRGFVHSQSFVFPELLIFVPYAHNDGRPVCIVMTEQEPVVPRRGARVGRRRVQRQQLHGQIDNQTINPSSQLLLLSKCKREPVCRLRGVLDEK